MNILPKKSWHVRNKDNVARVLQDEENARLEEEKLAKRAAIAEQEARTKLLRDRVHLHSLPDVHSSPVESQHSSILPYGASQTRNINLFEEEESGNVATKGTNAEYEAEKKAEQEMKEKALGVLKYLGQSTIEGETPWYLKKESKETTNAPKTGSTKDVDKKNRLDPLNQMNSFLEEAKKSKDKRKEKKKKEKKHKDSKKGKKTIAELRAERLQREKEESLRAQKLIRDSKKEASGKSAEEEDPYSGRYHSQYNPDLARKPKWNSRYHPY